MVLSIAFVASFALTAIAPIPNLWHGAPSTIEQIINAAADAARHQATSHGEGTATFNGVWFELPSGTDGPPIPNDIRLAGLVRGEDGELKVVPPRFAIRLAPQLVPGTIRTDPIEIPAVVGVVVYDSQGEQRCMLDPATGRIDR